MGRRSVLWCSLLTGILLIAAARADDWRQFRGPNASGVASAEAELPTQISPDQNVIWKTALPPGHSSPVVAGGQIYLTAARDQSLLTIAIDAKSGKVLWEREAPHSGLEEIHQVGSHAQPTPAADGEVVISLFGSAGLFAYDPTGKPLWNMPLGPFKNNFGAGSSPILVDDFVVLNQDHDTDSFLAKLNKRTGEQAWRVDRSEFPRSYSTPILWNNAGSPQIVVQGTLRAVGYDFETGREVWTVRGLSRIANTTPTVEQKGNLYLSAWAPGGDDSDRISVPTFDELVASGDANRNGSLEAEELTHEALKSRFNQIDRDKSDHIDRAEYSTMREVFHAARNVMVAVKPGGTGDITQTHVLWSQSKYLPYVPSPVLYEGLLFMVKSGGIASSVDAKTGATTKVQRVGNGAGYYSSPVAGDRKIYLVSERGQVSVLSAEPQWQELSMADLNEDVFATPAIVGGRIYLRTRGNLYCFGLR